MAKAECVHSTPPLNPSLTSQEFADEALRLWRIERAAERQMRAAIRAWLDAARRPSAQALGAYVAEVVSGLEGAQ